MEMELVQTKRQKKVEGTNDRHEEKKKKSKNENKE